MATLSNTIGLVNPGDIIRSGDINHLLASAPPEGMTDVVKDTNGNITFFRSLGRDITLTWDDDGRLVGVSCLLVAQSITLSQTVTWDDDNIPTISEITQS